MQNDTLYIDGGGSSLKVFRKGEDGKLLELCRKEGNFNYQSGCRDALLQALGEMLLRYPARHAVIGLAGLITPEETASLQKELHVRTALPTETLRVMSDLEFCFELHFPDGNGMLAILGTGSVFAAKVTGRLVKVGGYGRLLGDPGSGFSIGVRAARSFLRLKDGFFKDAQFESALGEFFTTREHAINAIYKQGFPVQSLAPVVIGLAECENRTARQLLFSESGQVLAHIRLLVSKLPDALPLPIKLCGGLVETPNFYQRLLHKQIEDARLNILI
ncbi:MAG: hypothetical protein HGB19_02645 [Chlorobiales bacterium]|nr:hypothetical protein [Chlorobiales bacterium]